MAAPSITQRMTFDVVCRGASWLRVPRLFATTSNRLLHPFHSAVSAAGALATHSETEFATSPPPLPSRIRRSTRVAPARRSRAPDPAAVRRDLLWLRTILQQQAVAVCQLICAGVRVSQQLTTRCVEYQAWRDLGSPVPVSSSSLSFELKLVTSLFFSGTPPTGIHLR